MTDDRVDRDNRPSPDALLEQAKQEGRGRLKVFLGAAPGVGKTYEMLANAQAKRREGVDIVVGVVETHGRDETEALLAGLEIVPRRRVEYKGRWLEEMDLDAILERRPKLVLVDELAHTNAPGSRHPKRYLDVEELLEAGIDVYTTLNIQHLESLNDVVAKITRIRVRETVPDSIIDRADDVEVVDLTPEDLIQRLKEGKVYVPQQAERAVRHYFLPGNLTALRELALRRTAQRVDEQMVNYMRAHAIRGPWAAGERVLVCVNEEPNGAAVVRYARRLADRLRAPWTRAPCRDRRAASASTRPSATASPSACGSPSGSAARPSPCRARTRLSGIVDYARANNFTHIVIAKSRRSRWSELLRGSVTHQLIRRAGDISVHVIAEEQSQPAGGEKVTTAAGAHGLVRPASLWRQSRHGRCGAGGRARPAAVPCGLEHRAGVPDRGAGERHRLWAVAVALRLPRQRARLQFLLPAAALHLHHRRSRECRGAVLLRGRRGDRQQPHGAGARAGADARASAPRPPRISISSAASSPAR